MSEVIYYDDKIYSDLTELCEDHWWDEEVINDFPDDFQVECRGADLKPIVKLSADWIIDRISRDRFSEDNEYEEHSLIHKALEKHIDFDKLNLEMPELYYENRTKIIFTKQDLLDAI